MFPPPTFDNSEPGLIRQYKNTHTWQRFAAEHQGGSEPLFRPTYYVCGTAGLTMAFSVALGLSRPEVRHRGHDGRRFGYTDILTAHALADRYNVSSLKALAYPKPQSR